ncbi:MAG TPA: TolC family protein [Bacteroidia bacterium]|nr:TolC family protein [Bacteroidia bacterium]
MRTKFLFILFLSLMISAAVQAQENNSFTLQQAIEYAYQHQSTILNAGLDEKMAIAKVKETRGIGLPQLSANFDAKDYFTLNYLFPGAFAGGEPGKFVGFPIETPSYSASAGVQASQLLFDGTYLTGLKAAKTYRELSQKNLSRTKIDIAVSVSKAYYSVLVNAQRVKLLDANVTRVQKLKDDTKALLDNGFVEKIDYDRVVLAYNNLVTERDNINRMVKLSDYLLKFQMGMDIYSNLALTDSLNDEELKNISVSAEKPDATKRIEYSLLQTQQQLMKLDLRRYRSQYMPSLVLYGNLYTLQQGPEFNVFDTNEKWYPTGFVGASLSLPLFDGLQREKKIQQAKLNLQKTENDIANTISALSLEAETHRTQLLNALSSLSTQKENLELANEVVRVSKLKYDQGVGSNLEVINAETSWREAQTNYYNALYDALVGRVEYDRAMGNIK